MTCYPAAQLWEEASFIAYYFHWNHEDIMSLSHFDRRKWCSQITGINKSLNNEVNLFA